MSTAFRFSTATVMQFKHFFRVPRPADVSPLVQPVLLTPGHGTFPAGHASQCRIVAELLKAVAGPALADVHKTQLTKLVDRIAQNRVTAGLHYEQDNVEGQLLGAALAKHVETQAAVPDSALGCLWDAAKDEWK
jgi:hypothetical protein